MSTPSLAEEPAPSAPATASRKQLWLALLAGPVLFLVASVVASAALAATGTPTDQLAQASEGWVPTILLSVQLGLVGVLLLLARRRLVSIAAAVRSTRPGLDLIGGALTGAGLAGAYFVAISPAQTWLQQTFGDYVPPGETTAALTTQVVPFLLANVLLAPVVEELLYRGFALDALTARVGALPAVVITTVAFGLLHWMGGFWYVVITAVVVGLPFALITLKRSSILWVLTAHLVLNAIEFAVLVWR